MGASADRNTDVSTNFALVIFLIPICFVAQGNVVDVSVESTPFQSPANSQDPTSAPRLRMTQSAVYVNVR